MKRHPALVNLSRDHYFGLLLAQQMKKGTPPYKGYPTDQEGKIKWLFADYEEKLKPHFAEEEEVLFPMASQHGDELKNLVEELVSEHRKLFQLIESVPTAADKSQTLDQFGILLENHIRKEERKLFEMIQKTFSEEELNQLLSKTSDSKNKK